VKFKLLADFVPTKQNVTDFYSAVLMNKEKMKSAVEFLLLFDGSVKYMLGIDHKPQGWLNLIQMIYLLAMYD